MAHKYYFKMISGMFMCHILGHSNIKMTERYAKLGRPHMAKTGGTAREMWKLLGPKEKGNTVFDVPALFPGSVIDDELIAAKLFRMWWPETGSNRRRRPFQGWWRQAGQHP
jgi:hypothetical protein